MQPAAPTRRRPLMSMLSIGLLFGAATLLVMFSGMPIAFALGCVATVFMVFFMPALVARYGDAERLRGDGGDHPAVDPALHPEGRGDRPVARRPGPLFGACMPGCSRVPGGLGIANVFACALFAAMAGSSPATCSAIGSAGIPEMRKRGYSPGFAAGIIAAGGTLGILLPPSITMILYAVASEQSLGRLFLAGIGPGLLLVACSPPMRCCATGASTAHAHGDLERGGAASALLDDEHVHAARRSSRRCRACCPSCVLLTGVMVALYGGFATPSETAGLGALLALVLIAADLRRLAARATWRRSWRATMREVDDADADHRHVAALSPT